MDNLQAKLASVTSAHLMAAMRWANVLEDGPPQAIAIRVAAARSATKSAIEQGQKIATLSPEAKEAIDAHCRDAEAAAACDWHIDAAKDMREAHDDLEARLK